MMEVKADRVQSLFGQPSWYLKREHNIRVRVETIRVFVGCARFENILDIGCGSASASLPLLDRDNRLTLVDFSEGMLSVARSRIPPALVDHVEIRCEDFMSARLEPKSFDLVICLGVLAHADDPYRLLLKIESLLKPGGTLLLEQTDSDNIVTILTRLMEMPKNIFVPERYRRNRLSSTAVLRALSGRGFKLAGSFRYSLPLPGMHRFFSQENLYRMIRVLFGTYPSARLPWLGNECLYHFKFEEAVDSGSDPAFDGDLREAGATSVNASAVSV